jgi:hypothetical protein
MKFYLKKMKYLSLENSILKIILESPGYLVLEKNFTRYQFLLGTIGFPKQILNLKNGNWVIISYSDLIWLNIIFATSV